MNKYDCTLILADSLTLTDDLADALFEAGCDDGTPGTSHGVFCIDFHREAVSLETAMRSAIEDVRTTGYEVARVEREAEAVVQTDESRHSPMAWPSTRCPCSFPHGAGGAPPASTT